MATVVLVGCTGARDSPIQFEDITATSGVAFEYFNGMTGRMTFVEIVGGGVATFDYDLDGDMDVYLVQVQNIHSKTDSTLRDRLYRNDSVIPGQIRLVDVTEASGITATGYGMGAAVGDINNDGWPDLYVTNWGINQLWQNSGNGTFNEVATTNVPAEARWSVSAVFTDFDRDGWQDLAVANYVDYSLENDHACTSTVSGRRDYCGPTSYRPVANLLLRNRGNGTFEDATLRQGFVGAAGASLGIAVADFDLNGWPDIYVANDGSDNRLWLNQDGMFRDEAVLRGAAVNMRGVPEASMGVAVGDFDGDLDSDLFLTHLNGETNTLYLNDGSGFFGDASRQSQLSARSIPNTGFGVVASDFDRDGRPDLFVANGDVRVLAAQLNAGDLFPLKQPNQLFRNGPNGFSEVDGWITERRSEVSRGIAAADLDNDGLIDLIISNNSGRAQVLRNISRPASDWIGIRLRDPSGTAVNGSQLHVDQGEHTQHSIVRTDGSYASASDPRRVFGVKEGRRTNIRVVWPDGLEETWTVTAPSRYLTFHKGNGTLVSRSQQQ